jgi:hypothetical protein
MEISELTDAAAVEALSLVAQKWMSSRGLQVYKVYHTVRSKSHASYEHLPAWAKDNPAATNESGTFARQMLLALNDSDDAEVREWTRTALQKVDVARVEIDPITLAIGGVILIGAILAARVKKMGAAEFYEGVPQELADVIKAGSSAVD